MYLCEEFLSDIEEGRTTGTCWCGAPAYYWIETDGDDGKYRALYCRPCGDRKLANLAANAEAAHKADAEATARLGYDPRHFCEGCGYRYSNPVFYFGCRCNGDFLQPAAFEVEPYSHPLYRDERREILAGWDRPRVPSLSD
jgi:hypothetical protein